ncbi:MAG: TROVE domain-containing protein [Oscillospiraceae bacterium]|nr:TROVE domain-containing protein [Oscillospiraceae bacterium]
MAKFNKAVSTKTVNHEGHVAYAMTDKSKLVTQVLCSFINESKFYGDNSKDLLETAKRVAKTDPQFISNLAVFARREFNMRSVAHVLTAILANVPEGKPFVRRTVQGVSLRGDDVTEIMSFYLATFGKPVPNSLKKGIADVLKTFDAYTLAKYKGDGHAVKMRDLLCLCRPKPKTFEQEALWKRCLEGTLEIPETWETQLSANGNNAETWEKLIDDGKLNYMAALRNLRNLLKAQPRNIDKVFKKLSDPVAVKKSRQLPFRFLSAYKEIGYLAITDTAVLDTLEAAIDASLANLQPIPGKTVIAIDVSGSMSDHISNKSSIRCCEIAMLIGLIANRLCESAVVYTFNDSIQKLSVPKRAGILYAAVNESRCGSGTNMDLPFTQMMKDKIKCDRVIIISDNMCNSGTTYYNRQTVQTLADRYRHDTGNDIWVHAIDLQGYGTQQFAGPKTNIIAGWSEKVFDFIALAEQGEGNLEKTIAAYQW